MKKCLFIAFVFAAGHLYAQHMSIPEELKPFVLTDHEPLDVITGDLNGDKRPDAILILKITDEYRHNGGFVKRPMLLLLRQANGKLKPEKRNDSLVMCGECGGNLFDPYVNTRISNNGFSVSFNGQDSSRKWDKKYTFTYDQGSKNWLLSGESRYDYDSAGARNGRLTRIGASELTGTNFDNFSSTKKFEEHQWTVKVSKTYFYTEPSATARRYTASLEKGQKVTGTREFTNFVEAWYHESNEKPVRGFLLKKDLEPFKP